MEKKDCLFAILDFCGGGSYDQQKLREILKQGRIRARKLVLISRCGGAAVYLPAVRALASENMDFPVRHYHELEVAEAAELERCGTYEVLNL